jgi:hypothetical protein
LEKLALDLINRLQAENEELARICETQSDKYDKVLSALKEE